MGVSGCGLIHMLRGIAFSFPLAATIAASLITPTSSLAVQRTAPVHSGWGLPSTAAPQKSARNEGDGCVPGTSSNENLFVEGESRSIARREFASSLIATAASCAFENRPVLAADQRGSAASAPSGAPPRENRVFLRGAVSLRPGTLDETGEDSALYVTARPDRPDNVPRAVLDGTGGRPPPVLAGRFANPKFPFEFSLGTVDLTVEGAARTDAGDNDDETKLWWEGENLVVSARLDSDGVAATRDPTDLVGRGFYSSIGESGENAAPVAVQLQGRGAAGKFFTGKGK